MKSQYCLFKIPDSANCEWCMLCQHIVRWAWDVKNINAIPMFIVERNYPPEIHNTTPSIFDYKTNTFYVGHENVFAWYNKKFQALLQQQNIDVVRQAKKWAKKNPKYRLRDDPKSNVHTL